MRLILIILTLLGGAVFGYALLADVHLANGWTDVDQVLYPKGEAVLPSRVSHNITALIDRVAVEHRRDAFIVSGIGGCIFILGFAGLIIERKRNASRNAA
ncbi:MAG: hypothetical protein P4N60_13410 [Verrucomicrobiae bacterium]|nr:hypothetical protein [Verrucomicrobiae bacterium]